MSAIDTLKKNLLKLHLNLKEQTNTTHISVRSATLTLNGTHYLHSVVKFPPKSTAIITVAKVLLSTDPLHVL